MPYRRAVLKKAATVRLAILTLFLASIPAFTNAQRLTWVLWEKNVVYGPNEGGEGSGRTTWDVLDGHEYKQGCETAAKGSSDANLEALREGKNSNGVASFKRYGPSQLIVVLVQRQVSKNKGLDLLAKRH